MAAPQLTDTELPLVADVIDAITAASAGDTQAVAVLIERLTPEQARHALALAVGLAGGGIAMLTDWTGIDRDTLTTRMRRRAAL